MLWLATLGGCMCWDLWPHGLSGQCPDSELRLSLAVEAGGLVRGAELPDPDDEDAPPTGRPAAGWLVVSTHAQWLSGDGARATRQSDAYSGDAEIAVTLVDAADGAQPVALGAFEVDDGARRALVALPEVPDGDYRLRVAVTAPFDEVTAEVPLALYAPALVHVMADRPLFRPGELVHLRSLVLRRSDLTPLGDRPGRWQVVAPDGVELLAETDTAGSWGVADTSLPLHPDAPPGRYRAIYTSGADRDELAFDVRPFELPRVRAELAPTDAWFAPGEPVGVHGVARYGSGAPVADAEVTVTLRSASGAWPPPLDWEAPQVVRTGADGTFRAAWGEVPRDLFDRSTLAVTAVVREPGGEAVSADTSLVLSQSTLWVEGVTELDDGLVGGANNRAYLRVARPDGTPLAGARVTVVNPWDPRMPPKVSDADEDGVVALQIDPGDPVTLVDPLPPVRTAPADAPGDRQAPSLTRGVALGEERELTLDEREALDPVPTLLEPCRHAEPTAGARSVAVQVAAGGGVVGAVPIQDDAVGRCVAERIRGVRFPAGVERTLLLDVSLPNSDRPYLDWDSTVVTGPSEVNAAVLEAIEAAGDAARTCLSPGASSGEDVLVVHWRARSKRTDVEIRTAPQPGTGLSDATLACLARGVARITLAEAPEHDGLGVATASLQGGAAPRAEADEPVRQATTRTGYELQVRAAGPDGAPLGDGKIRFDPGRIPSLRVRATPTIVAPGDELVVELLRGPDHPLDLPEKLALRGDGGRQLAEVELDENTARFVVPDDARGFLSVQHAGVTAHVWVQRPDRLALALTSDRAVYRPGELARLTLTTTAGGEPTQAAVGLSGVDGALGRIVALPGPDDYGRVTVRATSTRPPFGVFDARALLLGRIRGRNAAQAAVQRIVPPPPDSAAAVAAAGATRVQPRDVEVLTAAFGRAYPVALRRVRAWEDAAADGERFTNEAMAEIWAETLAELRDPDPIVDGWGRELTLRTLPPDLLAQLAPRQMLHDGTHLPEDLVAWPLYVSRSE